MWIVYTLSHPENDKQERTEVLMTDHSLIIQDDDDDTCEELEGHVALHNDVDNKRGTRREPLRVRRR